MHTFTVGAPKVDPAAVIAAMLSSLGTTRQCDDCLAFDRHGRAYTSAWRLAGGGYGVSFRHASGGPDRAYYRTAWDAARAVDAGEHNEAAYTTRKMDGLPDWATVSILTTA
jgi:hypothetical protein